MNHLDYINLLVDDLNRILPGNSYSLDSELNKFRLQVLILHLHADYLLGEIIIHKFNKSKKYVDRLSFKEKLDKVCETDDFDADWYDVLSDLNDIRNHLSHNLIADITSQENIINAMKLQKEIKEILIKVKLKPIQHLVFSCFGYLNILAEYLFSKIQGEKLEKAIRIQFGEIYMGEGKPPGFTIYFSTEKKHE